MIDRIPDPELQAAFRKAVRYLGYRARTVHEMETYLAGKQIPENIVRSAVDLLIRYQYLDDEAFSRQFVATRTNRSPKSRFALGYELRQKGIAPHIIDMAISQVDDHDMALRAAGNRIGRWAHLDTEALEPKVMNFLRYRGFSFDVCRTAWEKIRTSQHGNGKNLHSLRKKV